MKRHSWVKLRVHVYICRTCATGRVNFQSRGGGWFTRFHLPNGGNIVDSRVPPCEPGRHTAAWLAHYQREIEHARGTEIAELPAPPAVDTPATSSAPALEVSEWQ